ncbi:hypothetical protein FACS189414_3390 [Bacteroidia bacterium]|nr:hypothetical protein AGMMS49574_23590 [Bacteroidia bacterium]GHU76868.1 hypothetical protein FACS189414_3390 [Bacteroidia bacterium]
MKLKIMTLCLGIVCIAGCKQTDEGITIVSNEGLKKVDVLYDGKLFTSYIYPDDLEKPVLYPIYTANGTLITRGFPRAPRPNERIDHPHHVGLWFNFGDVNGLDFWNNSYAIPAEQKPNFGSIRHRSIASIHDGKEEGSLTTLSDWLDSNGKKLLNDETKYVFTGKGDLRIIEHITTLTAQQDTVVFTDNKEGLIGIRVDRAFEEPSTQPELFLDSNGNRTDVPAMNNEGVNGVYRNSEGIEKGAVWGKPTQWVSLSAEKEGEAITIAILDHKNNPGYPAHSHARGYGLFATNNLGSQVFEPNAAKFVLTLSPGKSVTFKHLIVVKTNGYLTDEALNKLSQEFFTR